MLTVVFDGDIHPAELPAFRGAVIQKAGREHVLFHNHISEDDYLRGYPVIQYKCIQGHPALMCLDYGIEDVHHLFSQSDQTIHIGERSLRLRIENLRVQQCVLQVWHQQFRYRIHNWLALSQKNYPQYKALSGDTAAQEHMLERLLTGNIISFAKGVKWQIDQPVQVHIQAMNRSRLLPYKGNKLMSFTLDFTSNVFLPQFIGLGKAASHGFGTVTKHRATPAIPTVTQNESATHDA